MADSREFVLIGSFKDGITPELAKINKQIADLKASFAGVGSKKNSGFRGATKEIGKLVSANKNLTSSFRQVQSSVSTTTGELKKYITVLNKATVANNKFQKSGGSMGGSAFARNMRDANREAERYLRTLQQINRQSPRNMKPPTGGGGGGGRGGAGGGRSSRGGMGSGPGGFHMAEFGFTFTLGNTLANIMTGAITRGFSIGVDIMQKPFQYFANALSERIQDEQSDIKAAGGIFAVSKRQKDPLVRTMDEAMEFTQENNKLMAELAAALPGSTQDYIETGKRISDSIARIVSGDRVKAIEYANQLRREEGKETIIGQDRAAAKQAYTTLLGQMTKQTTLAGLGGGARSTMGAYGLPQLTERMLTQDEVTMGQFQRYSAIFKDPLVMDALNRFIPKVNATTAGTMERFVMLDKMFKEVVPPEMIRKFERSSAGIIEMFNTAIFGPETGIFGIGRKMKGLGKAMDDYGRYITILEDGTRVVAKSIDDATDIDLSVFDLFRDILANVSIVLGPIITNLNLLFDPLLKTASLLTDARHATGKFLLSFEKYTKGFQDMAKDMSEADRNVFVKIPAVLRGSLASINNLLADVGIISEGEFLKNADKLMSLEFDPGQMIRDFLDKFLKSDLAGEIGELIGSIAGTVLSEVANVTGFVSGRIAGTGKLFAGLEKGFKDAKGFEAINKIFADVFDSLFKLLFEFAKRIPLKGYLLGGFMLILPAVAQGIGMKIASAMLKLPEMLVEKDILGKIFGAIKNAFSGVKPVNVRDLGSTPRITDPSRMLPAAEEVGGALAQSSKAGPLAKGMDAFRKFFTGFAKYAKGIGPRFLGFFKGLTGKLFILGGVITSIVSLFQGKDLATSLAEGAGPVLGAALGAALIPFLGPIGPLIGSMIGSWVGSTKAVTEPLAEVFQSLFGALEGFGSVIMMVVTLTGDLVGGVARLIGSVLGVEGEFDGLKIILAPITLAFQALEVGLKGLALLLTEMRVFFTRYFGSSEDYQKAIEERDAAKASMKSSQGRANAYNAPMLGDEALRKQLNNAVYELQNSKTLKADRSAELRAFISESRKLLGQKNSGGAGPTAPAPAVTPTKPAVGGVSGLTPTQADMAWYQKAMAGSTTPTTPPPAPPEVKATADNTLNLNAKAAQQITQSAQTHQVTQEVKTNTLTTNTILGNIKSGIMSVSSKVDLLQAAIVSNLTTISVGVTTMSNLLAAVAANNGGGGGKGKPKHVAHALGFRNPAFFSDQSAAQRWEKSMVSGSVRVASITGNSAEGFGGGTNVTNNINITQQPGQDSRELASLVAYEIVTAMKTVEDGNILV
jgi:hypothetical protein